MISATNSWIICFDNLTGTLPTWLADALCRISTGGGLAVRKHYEDAEETLFNVRRLLELAIRAAEGRLRATQAERLAGMVPTLIDEYNQGMRMVHAAATKVKCIGLQCRELGHLGALKQVDENIFSMVQQLPVSYTFAKWSTVPYHDGGGYYL